MKPRIPPAKVAHALTALYTYRARALAAQVRRVENRTTTQRDYNERHIQHALDTGAPVPSHSAHAVQRNMRIANLHHARYDRLIAAQPPTPSRERIETTCDRLGLLVTGFYTFTGRFPPWVKTRRFYDASMFDDITWVVFNTPTIDVGDLAVWRTRYTFWLPLILNFRDAVYMRAIHHEIQDPHRRYTHPTVELGGWFCLDGFTRHVQKALMRNDLPRAISIILTAIATGAPENYILDRCGAHYDRVTRELNRRYREAA